MGCSFFLFLFLLLLLVDQTAIDNAQRAVDQALASMPTDVDREAIATLERQILDERKTYKQETVRLSVSIRVWG